MTKREAVQQRSLEAFLAKKAEFDALLAGPDPRATSTDRTPDKGD